MYGKFFASTFVGSMMGRGLNVFAVWGYAIANAVSEQVELNPRFLAAVLGGTVEDISAAIEYLCSPDTDSRSKTEEGRRLVKEGQFNYRVVNHCVYRNFRTAEERREYFRVKKAESRSRLAGGQTVSNDLSKCPISPRMSSVSTYTDADTDADTDTDTKEKTEENTVADATSAPIIRRRGRPRKVPEEFNAGGGSLTAPPKQKKAPKSTFDALAVPIPEILRTDEFVALWGEWIGYRYKCGKPYKTDVGVRRQLANLERAGVVSAIKAIELSLRREWQGIFPGTAERLEQMPADGRIGSRVGGRGGQGVQPPIEPYTAADDFEEMEVPL